MSTTAPQAARQPPLAGSPAAWRGILSLAQRLPGRTAAVAGRHDRAHAHFEAAVQRHLARGAAAPLARTRWDHGAFLLQGRRTEQPRARRHLRDAAADARRLGMAGIAAPARATADGEASGCSY